MSDNHVCCGCNEAQVFRVSVRCIAHITEEIQTAATDNASNIDAAHEAGAGG